MEAMVSKAALFAAAARFVSKDKYHARLSGVYLEPCPLGGAFIVSVDGHRLFAGYDEGASVPEAMVVKPHKEKMPADWWKEAAILFNGEVARLVAGTLTLDVAPAPRLEVDFPKWRRVLPDAFDGTAANFNPTYLSSFNDVGKSMGCRKDTTISLVQNGKGPALVRFSGREDCFGIIMPYRSETYDKPLPDWFNLTAE